MKFSCKIDMDNAAFEDPHIELSNIFDMIKIQIERMNDSTILDSNGNNVGSWKITGKR